MLIDLYKNVLAKGTFYVSVLADSASFLLTDSEDWKVNPAVIVEMDNLNEVNDSRELRIRMCDQFEELKGDCPVIKTKVCKKII
jgi:hypothetical protein